MTQPIKITGIGCSWTSEEALFSKNRLCEVGFYAKLLYIKEHYYVLYSYRDFTNEEAIELLNKTFGGKI
jgi:hypothetical protein